MFIHDVAKCCVDMRTAGLKCRLFSAEAERVGERGRIMYEKILEKN
jgi:hypothetical protein